MRRWQENTVLRKLKLTQLTLIDHRILLRVPGFQVLVKIVVMVILNESVMAITWWDYFLHCYERFWKITKKIGPQEISASSQRKKPWSSSGHRRKGVMHISFWPINISQRNWMWWTELRSQMMWVPHGTLGKKFSLKKSQGACNSYSAFTLIWPHANSFWRQNEK